MKKERDYLPYIAILGMIAVVALVALPMYSGGIDGAVTSRSSKEAIEDGPRLCEDDDPTNDHYVAGTVRSRAYSYKDHCEFNEMTREHELHQYYCGEGGAKHTRRFNCPNGCSNGACLAG